MKIEAEPLAQPFLIMAITDKLRFIGEGCGEVDNTL